MTSRYASLPTTTAVAVEDAKQLCDFLALHKGDKAVELQACLTVAHLASRGEPSTQRTTRLSLHQAGCADRLMHVADACLRDASDVELRVAALDALCSLCGDSQMGIGTSSHDNIDAIMSRSGTDFIARHMKAASSPRVTVVVLALVAQLTGGLPEDTRLTFSACVEQARSLLVSHGELPGLCSLLLLAIVPSTRYRTATCRLTYTHSAEQNSDSRAAGVTLARLDLYDILLLALTFSSRHLLSCCLPLC